MTSFSPKFPISCSGYQDAHFVAAGPDMGYFSSFLLCEMEVLLDILCFFPWD